MLNTFADTWLVSALPTGVAMAMAAASLHRSRAALRQLDGVIYDFADLEPVRPVIILSMRLTVAYILLMLAFAGILAALVTVTDMSQGLAAAHMGVFGLITLPAAWYARVKELQLRELRVSSGDSSVEATYRLWLTMWNQPRVNLPQ